MNTEIQKRDIYERWHAATKSRDLEGLSKLYAEDTRFESPAVLALTGNTDGVLQGRQNIKTFFDSFFRKMDKSVAQWHRSDDTFLSKGNLLMWEYPRVTPSGDQTDLVESMDIVDGLIAHHRVYWGWVGLRNLLAVLQKNP